MPHIHGYDLHALETGRFGLDGGAMFGIVPKPLWSRRIAPDDRNRIPLAMRCLLMVGHGRVVLVDTGLGDKYDAKFADIFAVDHEHSNLIASLQATGFGVDDVTDVILTHLHFDHGGGGTRWHAGRLETTFPNARYHVQRSHWEWARASNPKENASFLAENLAPLAESGQLHLAEGAGDLWPGVDLLVVDGHTRGQQLVKLSGPEGTLLFAADLFPTTAHLPPVWNMAYDNHPLTSIAEKQRILETAYNQNWHLLLEHDAHAEVIGLEQTERGFRATGPRLLTEL